MIVNASNRAAIVVVAAGIVESVIVVPGHEVEGRSESLAALAAEGGRSVRKMTPIFCDTLDEVVALLGDTAASAGDIG